jgi:HAD superfamily phosphoserine phosphatase-like hydrolase
MLTASDLEGTLSAGEMWRAIGVYLKASPQRAAYQRMFRGRMPGYVAAKIGLIDLQGFKNDWFVHLAKLFAGWDHAQLLMMCTAVVDEHLWPQRRQAVVDELVARSRAGHRIAIVSGGYQPIVEVFAERLRAEGVHDVDAIATPLHVQNDRLTGGLAGTVCTGDEKVRRLRALLEGRTLSSAYGDTYADIPMLALAETAVAVCPDKGLTRAAAERGWRVLC